MLHSRVTEARRSLLETTDALVGLGEDIAVVEPGQIDGAETNQTSESGTELVELRNGSEILLVFEFVVS